MNLKLVINDIPFQLGTSIDSQALDDAEFEPFGMLKKFVNKIPRDQTWFKVENCIVNCFDEAFSLYPCTDAYLTHDRQWETAALLKFDNSGLFEIVFQVVDGQYAAASFLDRFKEACMEQFGPPPEIDSRQFSWQSESDTIFCIMHHNLVNADFIWKLSHADSLTR